MTRAHPVDPIRRVAALAAAALALFVFAPAADARTDSSTGAQTGGWSDQHVRELAEALSEAWTHGLDPDDYADPRALMRLEPGRARDRAADAAFFDLAGDLAFGRVDPRRLEEDWTAPVRDIDLEAARDAALSSAGVFNTLEALAPASAEYEALRGELVYRLGVRARRGAVPPGEPLRRGDAGARVDALRARLAEEGDYDGPLRAGRAFDARLEIALMRFQTRHNLAADGQAGPSTLAELNAAPEARIEQLRANLERWRWLPADLGRRHMRVNLADYRLEAWRDGRLERVHEAMIGKTYSRTPVFSEDMSYIEINPIWYTPGGLGSARLRALRYSPGWALSQGYRLVDLDTGRRVSPYTADWGRGRYRVIQLPGPLNAMGEVKFMFPNRHNVYIHDTPQRDLFANVRRDDSSGCVRVQDPHGLAAWVLAEEADWPLTRQREVFAGNDTTRVYLSDPIPVHILYFTAVPGARGEVRFVHDVYDRDQALIDALNGRLPVAAEPGLIAGAAPAAPDGEADPAL